MERNHVIVLCILFGLTSYSAYREGLFMDRLWSPERSRELNMIQQRMETLGELQALLPQIREELNEHGRRFNQHSLVFLPASDDPYGWTSLRTAHEVRRAGVHLREATEMLPPRIPARRGEQPRTFQPYRVRFDAEGDLDGALRLVEMVEQRNPFVVVAALEIGPSSGDEDLRQVTLVLEWPIWSDPDDLAYATRSADVVF